jgi:hypothetical protein
MLRLRRRHINGDPGGRRGRLASAARRLASAAADLAFQAASSAADLALRAADLASPMADALRWPFERAAWVVERRLLWPLQERLAGWGPPDGWAPPGYRAGAAALAAIGVAAILAAVLILPGGGKAPPERSAKPARLAIVTPKPQAQPQSEEPQLPTLQGTPPHFSAGKSGGVAAQAGGGEAATAATEGSGSNQSSAATDAAAGGEGAATAGEAAATASSAGKPVAAGPVAMKTARRFSEAFVFYEIGKKPARAKAVFGETATPQLAEALDERPPRLPSNAKVPKAKVLNLVPGPRFGEQYTVSVSLLRVGITSELRLTLQKEKDGEWRVAQILG